MNLLEKAEMVAKWAHRNQTDLSGMPYWVHCSNVAMNLRAAGYSEAIQSIGWMHDVVEDTDVKIADLYQMGFGEVIVKGVAAMTQLPGQDLETYWAQVKRDPDARVVKLFGDIPDNDDEQRRKRLESNPKYAGLGERQRVKYQRARKFLMTHDEWVEWMMTP